MKKLRLFVSLGVIFLCGCNAYVEKEIPPIYYSPETLRAEHYRKELQEIGRLASTRDYDNALRRCEHNLAVTRHAHPEWYEDFHHERHLILGDQLLYLIKMGKPYEAIPVVRKRIEFCHECDNSEYSSLYINLAILLDKVDRFEEAVNAANKAISFAPDNVTNYILLSQYLTKRGDLQETVNILRRALKIDPNNARTHFRLGGAYIECNEIQKAVVHFESTLELDPNHPHAPKLLRRCLEHLEKDP